MLTGSLMTNLKTINKLELQEAWFYGDGIDRPLLMAESLRGEWNNS